MRSFLLASYEFLIRIPDIITPRFVKERADPERFGIDQFVFNDLVPRLKKTDRLLDAGAGSFRYKHALDFTKYESTDFEDIFDADSKGKHTFTCSLDNIPLPDNQYDVIVNTQVLEHVEFPEKVVSEMARVLKPGGTLYLTTPQISHVHGAPYNFFFFTPYGLRSLFERAGLTVESISPRGGVFWVLGKISSLLPSYLFYQHAFTGFKKGIHFKPKFRYTPLSFMLIPFYVVFQLIFGYYIPFLCFYLDRLDRQKDFSLGYACIAVKK